MRKYTMIQKISYSTSSCYRVDKGKGRALTQRMFDKKLEALNEEKESLQYDLDNIGDAIKAASKISSDETLLQEEQETLSELMENYPTFFDSEGEEEGSSSLLNKVMGVKRYLTKEFKTNKKSIVKLIQDNRSFSSKEEISQSLSSKRKVEDVSDSGESSSSKRKVENMSDSGEPSSSKRKVEDVSDSGESSSSKKTRLSTSEYLDDLPYNPFDDLGTD